MKRAEQSSLFETMFEPLPPAAPAEEYCAQQLGQAVEQFKQYVKGHILSGVCREDLYYGTEQDRGRLACAKGSQVTVEIAETDSPEHFGTRWVHCLGKLVWTFHPEEREKFERYFEVQP